MGNSNKKAKLENDIPPPLPPPKEYIKLSEIENLHEYLIQIKYGNVEKEVEDEINNLLEQALVSIYGETFDPWNIGADCIKANFTNYHRSGYDKCPVPALNTNEYLSYTILEIFIQKGHHNKFESYYYDETLKKKRGMETVILHKGSKRFIRFKKTPFEDYCKGYPQRYDDELHYVESNGFCVKCGWHGPIKYCKYVEWPCQLFSYTKTETKKALNKARQTLAADWLQVYPKIPDNNTNEKSIITTRRMTSEKGRRLFKAGIENNDDMDENDDDVSLLYV